MKAVLDHVLVWGTRNLMLLTRRYRVIHTAGICSILTAIGTSVQVKEAAHSSRHIVSAYPPPPSSRDTCCSLECLCFTNQVAGSVREGKREQTIYHSGDCSNLTFCFIAFALSPESIPTRRIRLRRSSRLTQGCAGRWGLCTSPS